MAISKPYTTQVTPGDFSRTTTGMTGKPSTVVDNMAKAAKPVVPVKQPGGFPLPGPVPGTKLPVVGTKDNTIKQPGGFPLPGPVPGTKLPVIAPATPVRKPNEDFPKDMRNPKVPVPPVPPRKPNEDYPKDMRNPKVPTTPIPPRKPNEDFPKNGLVTKPKIPERQFLRIPTDGR